MSLAGRAKPKRPLRAASAPKVGWTDRPPCGHVHPDQIRKSRALRKVFIAAVAGVATGIAGTAPPVRDARGAAAPTVFQPPPDSAIPSGAFGDDVRLGERIFRETGTYAAKFVGNDLRCTSCHLDGGRRADAGPMWAAYVSYPAFREKNGHVNSFEERLQGCFSYSMNGKAPPPGDPVLVALESYSFFLARGLPTGVPVSGRGYPALPKPSVAPDYRRGADVYLRVCASCHGADGAGLKINDATRAPPLWGARSYNWGAGMASIDDAARFIAANMPLGNEGTLAPQQAWDVAFYVDSQVRPQDPRFTGDLRATRDAFHGLPFSTYGQIVNGALLGDPAVTPPAGTGESRLQVARRPCPPVPDREGCGDRGRSR